jgi:hypothetical protein
MNRYPLFVAVVAIAVCMLAGPASAQVPISFNWSEQINLAHDSAAIPLGTGALAWVVWDVDGSGLDDWDPSKPLPDGDVILQDQYSAPLEFAFNDFLPGNIVGNWTVNDGEAWQADGELLYLLVWAPDTITSSGLDEWGVTSEIAVNYNGSWPNTPPIEHDIVGGGPITTVPVIWVDWRNVAGPWDGSPTNPYQTIQDGIDAAPDGSIVMVRSGTYTGAENKELDFGGKAIIVRAQQGAPDTTIDCEGAGRGFYFHTGEGNASVVDGFTITGGVETVGGGIYCDASSPTIANCILSANAADGGGAITLFLSSARVTNCLLFSNIAGGGGGIYCHESSPDITHCTLSANSATSDGGGGICCYSSTATITDCILWGNSAASGHEIALTNSDFPSTLTVRYSDVEGGGGGAYVDAGCVLDLDGSDIDLDPLFVSGPVHNYYLSQIAAGQGVNSPCIDAGSNTAANLGLDELTTRTDGVGDAGTVDMGFHTIYPLWITDVWYDMTGTAPAAITQADVHVTFSSKAGVSYDLEGADGAEYNDSLTWTTVTTGVAAGASTTLLDDLLTNPVPLTTGLPNPVANGKGFRFYRVKVTGTSVVSRQTVGVFQMTVTPSGVVSTYFVSTPLVPDVDHDSVAQVFGEKIAGVEHRQMPRNNFMVSDLDEPSQLLNRMRNAAGTYAVLAGSAFNIEAGRCYQLSLGAGPNVSYALRLTGYVSETPVAVNLDKPIASVVSQWFAYSMPRTVKLSQLGLPAVVTPWQAANRVKVLWHGDFTYTLYRYQGGAWLPSDPDVVPGTGLILTNQGPSNKAYTLIEATWYFQPPNSW